MLRHITRSALAALVIASQASCTVNRTVKVPTSEIHEKLARNAQISVELISGKRFRAVVVEITNTELITTKNRYYLADIRSISYAERDNTKSFFATLGWITGLGIVGYGPGT